MDINEFFYSEALMANDMSARITQKELLWPQGRKGLAKVLGFLRSLFLLVFLFVPMKDAGEKEKHIL